jgi:hypothetical protein
MLKGVHLTLMIGPAVPIPAPQPVLEALTSVQVNSGGERSGFQLTFSTATNSPLLTTMLPAGYFDPIVTRVMILVTLNGVPNVIMDGFVTRQEIQPSSEPGQSTLTITGEDLSVVMDLVQIVLPYPALPDYATINLALAKYAFLGIIPVVVPPPITETRTPMEGWETQTETDLGYVRGAATRCGYVFYIEPGPLPGQSLAYFGPDIRIPVPQHALNINMDAHTNVESMSFSLDGLQKELEIVTILDPITRRIPIPVPIPEINVFKPPLGARPTAPSKIVFNNRSASLTFIAALKHALAKGMRSSAAISASGSLDVLVYGHILRSRLLVGVRGAGLAYDGLYYVDNVTHTIKTGEYKQNFTLSRDGLISLTPKVIP